MHVFVKGHIERRLRRLRQEIQLQTGLSDETRSALTTRVDAALELWKLPRYTALLYSLPGILSLPTWYKQSLDLLDLLNIKVPVDLLINSVGQYSFNGGLFVVGVSSFSYLLTIPTTSFLAKRGLFIGRESSKVYYPGGKDGSGIYAKEREILGTIGLMMRESPIDIWATSLLVLLSPLLILLFKQEYMASITYYNTWIQSIGPANSLNQTHVAGLEDQLGEWTLISYGTYATTFVFFSLCLIALLRRRKTGRD
jgi:hypothetical protein